ncbi:hypothetical protein MTsPCn5_14600 [Croceitalea sp. MTPC5]|uniref:Ig-like domain-containing protein n=1 Tax=Croceitalea sp. MTPC5 TaxID=3056565 RepID=UPI002B3C3A6B|nr:hypothetical protein MTsPCn5_14600 [Croceitalea sp. MTPC5]
MKQNYFCRGSFGQVFLTKFHTTVSIILIAFLGLSTVQAQEMKRIPGEVIVEPIPKDLKDANSRMAMRQMSNEGGLVSLAAQRPATADLQITFGPGAQGNEEVQEAFQFALDIWAREIVSSVPIQIFADFADLGPGVLASAGPTTLVSNFPGAPLEDVFYPIALASSLAGTDLAPDTEFDLVINLGNGIPFYFGTDGNTPPGQFDFVTIALHEAGHGLGFIDGGNVDGSGTGSINGGGNPFVFDIFIVDGSGNSVLDIPNPSEELGDFFTSGDVFVNGQFAREALNGNNPELFAPNPFQGGSSIAHWDEAVFPTGDPNSLMTPQAAPAESNFDIGDITRGHFRDMGWVLAEQAPIAVVPSVISEELNVGESLIVDLTVNNISEAAVDVVVTPSDDAIIFGEISPAEFTLALDGSATVSVELITADVPAGIYEEVLTFASEGSDLTFQVPVTLRVLDGTEVPIIEVDPSVFELTVEQFQIETRDLAINNIGNDDLSVFLTVDQNNNGAEFAKRAKAFDASIATNGMKSIKIGPTRIKNKLSALKTVDGSFNQVVTDLFAEDFESFVQGDINGQEGWFAQGIGVWTVSGEDAFEGDQHLRAISDGSAAQSIALSPNFTLAESPFSVLTAQVNVEGSGVTWEIIPQNTVEGLVATRLRFNGDGSVDVLDGGVGAFVPIDATVPEGYFEVRIVVDRDTLALSVFFNGMLVHSGQSFATAIDNVALLSLLEAEGSTFDVDNLQVIDGDEDAFFLSVSPQSAEVPFGGSTTATVTFDARTLEPGMYNAAINISSNDPANPFIVVPVSLTVVGPPVILINPGSLSAAVDIAVDDPPTAERTLTISNTGSNPLEFTTSIGAPTFTPPEDEANDALLAQLDRSIYGGGSASSGSYKAVEVTQKTKKFEVNSVGNTILENATQVTDSLFYDTGIDFPNGFGGIEGVGISTAVLFVVDSEEFTLTSFRNAYRTEDVVGSSILLQIYSGGETPNQGELIHEQVFTGDSPDGVFALETLNRPFTFEQGESFWVVHSYSSEIGFPQGQDDNVANTVPGVYAFSTDGGETFTLLDGFAFLTRALSETEQYISLLPNSGTVAPGESVDVTVTFDGSLLANGTYESDIVFNSNDPIAPSVAVPTTFQVSGQTTDISISDEVLLFNDVFVGNSAERTFTITNSGVGNLTISSIASDNNDFTVEPSSGSLISGEQLEVTVTFSPSTVGSGNGVISITSDAEGNNLAEVLVNGVGVSGPFAVLEPEQNEVTLNTGETRPYELTLRNEGESPMTYSFPEFIVANAMTDPNANFQKSEVLDFPNFSRNQSKGFKDTRVGAPVKSAMGTDLEFGYTWIDSNEPGGPVNAFFDISQGIGQDITSFLIDAGGFADATASLTLPFPFPFYGGENETLFINANGFLAFELPTGLTFINDQIPVEDSVNNIIAPFWTDLEPGTGDGGTVHIAGNDELFIIQWTDAPGFFTTGTVTFQVIIFSDGTIDVYYDDVENASFVAAATVGIENSGATDGAQVAFNTPYATDGLALRFIPPAPELPSVITAVSPLSGVLGAGQEETITVTLDAGDLEPAVYLDELMVSSNSTDLSRSTAFFEVTVVEPVAQIVVTPDALDFGEVFVGNTGQETITIENIGSLPLEITNITLLNGAEFSFNDVTIPFVLEPGESQEVAISFEPSSELMFTDDLIINSNDTTGNQEVTVSLTGTGVVDDPILSFILINADTNMAIGPINDGDVINLADFPTSTEFNIEVLTGDLNVESVIFDFNASQGFRTENVAPYALAGDRSGNFFGLDFPIGVNSVTATAFTGNGGSGDISASESITFEVIEDFTNATIELILVNASTEESLGVLQNNATIDLADFPEGTEFTVEALVTGFNDESVVFDLNQVVGFRTENFVPYALAGDSNSNFFGAPFVLGSNTIVATAFNGNGGNGAQGPSIDLTFELLDSGDDNTPDETDIGLVLIDADTDTPITSIVEGQVIDLSELNGIGLSIEAVVDLPDVGSVRFDFNGTNNFRTENVFPYALNGDRNGDFDAIDLALGNNTITISVFEKRNRRGALLQSLTLNFTVIGTEMDLAVQMSPNPSSDLVELTLAKGQRQQLSGTLFNLFGQAVYSNLDFDLKPGNSVSIDVSKLAQGVYILELRNQKGAIVSQKKLVKR